ncbi:MAG TPA: hypothetical protein VG826_21530 [Pirellulales bacterium]|nr:hypothetical protein [Pirellulales bacterium]
MRRTQRNNQPSGFFTGREFSRLSGSILMLVVLAMLITSASRPSTWTWLAGEADDTAASAKQVVEAKKPAWKETIVPGPTGAEDSEEQGSLQEELQAVSDKASLSAEEMPSYWRLLRWARSQSFSDMRSHARRDVLYTQLWQQPEKYRGQLISLRLHLVRSLEHEAPENPEGFKRVCEVWAWTDESQSFPYVAVLVERPGGLKLGGKIDQDGNFVGYFLKTMAYTDALGERRASPLLLGRLQLDERRAAATSQPADQVAFWQAMAVGGAILLAAGASWYWRRRTRRPATADADTSAETESWLRATQAGDAPPEQVNGRFKDPSSSLFDVGRQPGHDE